MPEGSLVVNIQTLEGALGAITGLLGEAPQGDQPGTGLAGASGLASTSPGDSVGSFEGSLTVQVDGLFNFDASGTLTGVTDLFSTIKTEAQSSPTQALDGFTQQITQINEILGGDFVQTLQQALDAIRSISEGIPENPTTIVSALLDQILKVLGNLDGPEAETISAWAQTLEEMRETLMPLIEQAQNAPDPAAVVVEVFRSALDKTLDIFGFSEIRRLVDLLFAFAEGALPQDLLDGLSATLSASASAYGQVQAAVAGDFPTFREAVGTAATTMQDLREHLRPVMSVLRQITTAPIFQPNALENLLRQKMDEALGVQVQEAQTISDPFEGLFDRIDEAIEAIDLSVVRTEVLGFFENARQTIEQVDIASVADFLQEQLGTVESVVQNLQQGVTDLLGQIEAFFDNLVQQLRALAENVGTFDPDGTFHYRFEEELRGIFNTARVAIGGDPDNPDAPSVAGSLNDFQSTLDQFLNQITGLLQPVEDAIDTTVDTAVQGIEDFSTFLQSLDVPALIEQLRQKVEKILDALLPIDFAVVVDPVVAEIEEGTVSLRDIDTESLNDFLRQALKLALDVIIQVDFTATIATPLTDEFAAVKAIPAQAIDELQKRYEEALSFLDSLKPERLLEAFFSAFDVIEQAVGSLKVATLLKPLDDLHKRFLQQPLAALKPSTVLQPLSDGFQSLTSVLDDLNGTAIIGPLDTQLQAMKSVVADVDITSWVDDLIAAVATVQQNLRDIRPSDLLQPLIADFERLESELDRFSPSVLFAPAVELAAPLLGFLENIQQQLIDALFEMFQAPLQVLERLQPEVLTRQIQDQIDTVINALQGVNLPTQFNQLKAQYFDLKGAVEVGGVQAKIEVTAALDPEIQLGEIVRVYNGLIATLEQIKQNVQLPNLGALYTELQERLLGMLPPYARALLDPETFKRIMRLADPTRFLEELDTRFQAIKNRLIPIRPQDIAAELDATYDTVLALVDDLDVEASLNQVKDILNQLKGIVDTIRIDFLAADIDKALDDIRAVVHALDPAVFFTDLDAIHHEVELVVQSTVPSVLLAGLQAPLDQVQGIVSSINPRQRLGPPLNEAWEAILGVLDQIDFTIILSPLVDKLDELEAEFIASLRRTETAFDQMLGAASGALGSGGASASVSIGGSI